MNHKVLNSSPYLLACLLLAGCGQSEDADLPSAAPAAPQAAVELSAAPAVSAVPEVSATAPAPAADGSAAPIAIAASEVSADAEQALVQLNQVLTGVFLAEIGRPPKSVNEFVERGLIRQLPKAPAGKKFFYDPQQNRIVLADRQPGDVDPAPLTPEQAQRAYMQTASEINKRIGN